jgi:uncharacterized protein (TIGR04255 family)
MDFEPINGDHAIQSAAFVYALANPLGSAGVNALRNAHNQIRRELPAQSAPQPVTLAMNAPFPLPIGSQGVEFSYFRPDGTAIWTLRAIGQEIAVETTRYLGWEKSWQRAHNFLKFALSQIASAEPVSVVATALRIVDRFRALKEDYDLSTILKPNEALASSVWKHGALWHSHSGWFENSGADQVLHTLNFDARGEPYLAPETDLPKPWIFLNITHVQQTRFTEALVEPISQNETFQERLDASMHAMHASNKALVQSLFTAEVCERIGVETPP